MTKAELFQNIDIILEYLYQHQRTRIIDFSAKPEDKDLFRQVYKEIYPHVTPDLNCLQCLLDCMNNLLAWKTREYPRYLKSIEPIVDTYVEPIEQEPDLEAVERAEKIKKKRIETMNKARAVLEAKKKQNK